MNSKAVLRQLAIDELIVQSIGDFLRPELQRSVLLVRLP
jgi:hypothetical protein